MMIDTKALRQKILDMAIKGQLVPQDPNDEPASVLLERIREEKQRLIKEGKIKKDKNDSVIFKGDDNRYYEKVGPEVKDITEDLPFEIPDSWAWTRLSTITFLVGSKENQVPSSQVLKNGSIPVVSQSQNLIDGYSDDVKRQIDILPLIMFGDHTKVVKYIDFPFVIGADGTKFHKGIIIQPKYLFLIIIHYAAQIPNRGYARHYSLLKNQFFPIPPLSEQQRIVAQIEELFTQIDAIEQNQADIDTLYEEFRKRTLMLAIQGKLVPQNPNDEPASILLERIRAEKKAKLGKKFVDSYIYKGDDNCYYKHITGRAQDEPVEVSFDIPENWAWTKLLDLGCFSSGKTPDMSEPAYWQNGNVQWFTSKDMKTKYLTESQLKITELAANDMTLYPANTLLWVVRSGILKSSLPICILKQPATINQDIKAYQLYQSSMIDYVYYMLKGMEARILDNYVKRITTVHSLKFDELISKLVVPIPPLAEQKRIVAKINEMFAML